MARQLPTNQSTTDFFLSLCRPVLMLGLVTLSLVGCGGGVAPSAATVSVADSSVPEGNSGPSNLVFTVSLSALSSSDVTVAYATADGSAKANSDYTAKSGTLTIPAGQKTATVKVTVQGDTTPEADETLTLSLNNPSGATLGTASAATGSIVNDDPGGLNDTGITTCSDGSTNGLPCPKTGFEGQDADYGRDANPLTNSDADGHAGFSFSKVCNSGEFAGQGNCPADPALGSTANAWGCTYDNVTGLMWEVKTTDSGLRDKDSTYTWYNQDNNTNGGSAGTANGGTCFDSINCDTEKFVAQVNAAGLCGHTDWRLPTRMELKSLVDYSIATPPTIDTNYFPNTTGSWFWSSSPYAIYPGNAWGVTFNYGYDNAGYKYNTDSVRLVRAGQ